jgi:hypothetical protein
MEAKRKAELTLVALLGESLSDFNFYPSKGGFDDGGTTKPRPPFGAICIHDADITTAREFTWLLKGKVTWVSRASTPGGDVAEHADVVKQIYDALDNIGDGYDVERNVIIHGIEILSTSPYSDAARLGHGDIVEFAMGMTEL